jgi:pimeloyl-ACP methyl ester carboxylesterase
VADAVAVLDATATDRAVVVGLSMGGAYALRLAAEHADRVLGAVFIGPAIPLDVGRRDDGGHPFDEELDTAEGWAKYNAHAWRRDWAGFTEFFMGQMFSEPHSTKPIEDSVGWAAETDPETMITAETAPYLRVEDGKAVLFGNEASLVLAARVSCPSLVIHGTDDRIIPVAVGRRLAEILGARLVLLDGSGHSPLARDPVKINLLIREFATRLATGGGT